MNIEEELQKNRFRQPGPFLEGLATAAAQRGLRGAPERRRFRLVLRWAVCAAPVLAMVSASIDARITDQALHGGGRPSLAAAESAPEGGPFVWPTLALRTDEDFARLGLGGGDENES